MVQSVNRPTSGFDMADFLGVLVHIEVLGVETAIPTVHGPRDAIRVNWTALDGPTPGRSEVDSLIFPKVLQNQLRGCVGQAVVGRLGQRPARPGQSPAWELLEATEADIAAGNAYEASRQQGPQSVAPPNQQPPMQPAGWSPAQPQATAPRF